MSRSKVNTKKDKLEDFKTAISSTIRSLSNSNKIEVAFGSQESKSNSNFCLLYTSPSPRDRTRSRMPSSA